MQNINYLKSVLSDIGRNYGVKRVFLFGSYAKGTANEGSDVDVLIEKGRPLSLLKLSGMRQDIEAALNLPVDLITTTGIEPAFRDAIAGTEILMYEE